MTFSSKIATVIVTALAILTFTSTVSAHAIERPRTTVESTQPIPLLAPPMTERARGSFGYELLGGTIGLTLGAALAYAMWVQPGNSNDIFARRMLGVFGMVPLAIAVGVHLAGERSGGNGRFMSAWGGAIFGMFAGMLLSLPFAPEDAPDNRRIAAMVPCVALGMIGGSLLHYRLTARLPAASITPTIDGRGAMFMLRGVM